MTISEVVERKSAMEAAIKTAIESFIAETGMKVNGVYLNTNLLCRAGKEFEVVIQVETTINL